MNQQVNWKWKKTRRNGDETTIELRPVCYEPTALTNLAEFCVFYGSVGSKIYRGDAYAKKMRPLYFSEAACDNFTYRPMHADRTLA